MPREPAIGEPTLEEAIQLIYERIRKDLLDFADEEIYESLTWSNNPTWSRKAQKMALKKMRKVVDGVAARFAKSLANAIEDELDRYPNN